MATSYWDYNTGTGTSSGYHHYNDTSATASSVFDGDIFKNLYSTGYRTIVRTRRILVTSPKSWTKEQTMLFTKLVNVDTETGWKVTMVISGGDIVITDPDVERRSMDEFIPLLKDRASKSDIEKINEFMKCNPSGEGALEKK